MTDFGGEKTVDVQFTVQRAARPDETGLAGDLGERSAPIAEQAFVGTEGARQVAGGLFGIQDMAEPDQQHGLFGEVVSSAEGAGDFQGIAQGQEDGGIDVQGVQGGLPQGQQAAKPRVLDDDRAVCAEFSLQNGLQFPASVMKQWRRIPFRVKLCPIVPTRAGRLQDPVVEVDQRLGFPEAFYIMLAGGDQMAGQAIAEQTDNAGERRGAAAMHTCNQDGWTVGEGHGAFHSKNFYESGYNNSYSIAR